MTTPYEKHIGVWHWKGDSIVEETIADVATTFKRWAPNATGVWVKTSDGTHWQGEFDSDRDLAIDGPDNVKRWVQTLGAHGLEFHAWSVPKGLDLGAEVDLMIQTCNVSGVKSMILDVEPFTGFWEGGREQIRPFMSLLRKGIDPDFHIGIAVDPRPHHYNSIFPDEWFPFVDSVHLMAYWESFERPVKDVIDEAFATWGHYGRPLIPILQTNANAADMEYARKRSIEDHGATGVSWWRLGAISSSGWSAINVPVGAHNPDTQEGHFGRTIVVAGNSPRFAVGTHTGKSIDEAFDKYTNTKGWPVLHKATTSQRSEVWARWDPQLTQSGWYEVSAFVPAQNATTIKARYKIHGVQGRAGETLGIVSQDNLYNVWSPLGVYYFDASDPVAGVVFLNDLTGEDGREIAFDALRWREVLGTTPTSTYLADGFDPPTGTAAERASGVVWPGNWFDATGFAVRYRIGTPYEAYHTGVDLNLNKPNWDADAHSPVYAAASGIVTYAERSPGWGNVIIIKHDPLLQNGQIVYTRYAHVENMRVQVGERVVRGEQIGSVGDAFGAYPFHLHYDVSHTTILQSQPWHWPMLNLNNLLANYVDPKSFTSDQRPPEA